jgi:hypothetical protein
MHCEIKFEERFKIHCYALKLTPTPKISLTHLMAAQLTLIIISHLYNKQPTPYKRVRMERRDRVSLNGTWMTIMTIIDRKLSLMRSSYTLL